jgi:hypothetical protein
LERQSQAVNILSIPFINLLITDVMTRWLFFRRIVADGNFSGDSMRMKNPEDDVPLTNGQGFTVQMDDYKEHLKLAKEIPQVCKQELVHGFLFMSIQKIKCHNHRAVTASNLNRKNLAATGIGACACARHGCFVPHSVVDFQKGERYAI